MYWKNSSNCCTFKFNRLLLSGWILHDIIFPRESNTRNQTTNTFLLLLNGWILHDIIFPREWNTRNQTLNTFFLPQSNIGISFVFDFLCYKNSVLPTCNLSCSIFPASSWPWRVLGKIYSFVLWMCLLSWTYLKLPLSAKVHLQSCCLNCIRNTVTKLARVCYTLFR